MQQGETQKPTERLKKPIDQAIDILKNNFQEIITVKIWARKVGYSNARRFSEKFRREFYTRPQPVLTAFRVREAIRLLRQNKLSNYEIALKLNLRDEKGLYQFVKNQIGHSPSVIQNFSDTKYEDMLKKLEKKIIE